MNNCDHLIFDVSGLVARLFFAINRDGANDLDINMTALSTLHTFNKYYKKYKPENVHMCFDSGPTWRLLYTRSDKCITDQEYKFKRKLDQKPETKKMFVRVAEYLDNLEDMFRSNTKIHVHRGEGLEADDLIAGLCAVFNEDKIVILSGDKDFTQLINENVTLFDPVSDKPRTLDGDYLKTGYNGDPDLFRFDKFIRGDSGDSVKSSYPYIRKTRLIKAFTDDFERANVMQHRWTDPKTEIEYLVEDLFNEGKLLMSLYLEDMPHDVQKTIITTISDELERKKKFSMFHFIKYCGVLELHKITEQVDTFIPLLSNNPNIR